MSGSKVDLIHTIKSGSLHNFPKTVKFRGKTYKIEKNSKGKLWTYNRLRDAIRRKKDLRNQGLLAITVGFRVVGPIYKYAVYYNDDAEREFKRKYRKLVKQQQKRK